MSDEQSVIRWILEAQDDASDKFANVGASLDGLSTKSKIALAGIGAAAAGGLMLAMTAAADQEAAINKAARATQDAAGGYDQARAAIAKLNDEMELQGFSTDKTTAAFSALVNKAGMDLPTALKNTADLLAYSELTNNTLEKSIRQLGSAQQTVTKDMEGAAKIRLDNLDMTTRLSIATGKLDKILVTVGEKLLPLADKALTFATILMDAFGKLDPAIQDIVMVFGILGAVIASVVGTVAGLSLAFAPILAMFAPGGAFAGVATTVISVLTGAAAAVAGLVLVIVAELALLKYAWDTDLNGVRTIVEAVFSIIQSTIIGTINAIGFNFAMLLNSITETITGITSAVDLLVTGVSAKWNAWTAGLVQGIVDFGVKVLLEVGKFVTGITKAFEDLIKKGLDWGAQLVANVLQGIMDKAREIADAAASAASSAYSVLTGTTGATGLVAQGVRPLAMGGIITQPTMALLGEGGENEYVIPESKMASWVGGTSNYFTVNLNVAGDIDERNREFVINTIQQELATLWRSSSR